MDPPGWRGALGLARSLAIYYGVPGRARSLRRLYAGIVEPGDLAFDIGAHVGHRTRALHALGANVIAVEPQALMDRWLRRTLPRDVVVYRAGAGEHAGTLDLAVSRRHPTVSTGSASWRSSVETDEAFAGVVWDGHERVPLLTLDELIAHHGVPRFCKIDVEGMEPAVLRGLSRPLPWIAVEYLPAALQRAHECLRLLAALGDCRINLVRGEAGAFAWDEWLTPGAAGERLEIAAADGQPGDLYAWFPAADRRNRRTP